jgi:hypothetical protein
VSGIRLRVLLIAAMPALVTCLAIHGFNSLRPGQTSRQSRPDLQGWDLPRLVGHLQGRGLTFRTVSTDKAGKAVNNVFLTVADKEWIELTGLAKTRESAVLWKGTVFCERISQSTARDVQMEVWGDLCLRTGPFLFFGDPDLLAKIRAALEKV